MADTVNSTPVSDELIKRLRELLDDDHDRGCQGREYSCSCGYDVRWGNALGEAADALEAAATEAQRQAARDVLAERQRQVTAEGWTPEHDDKHDKGEMASAAGLYALAAGTQDRRFIERHSYSNDYFEAALKLWPWAKSWWKPTDRRRDLVKAGALILAEIERLDRALSNQQEGTK